MLRQILKYIACAGRYLTSSILPAPKYWDMMDEMALRVWPNIQISIDKNEPTIPTAANDSSPSTGILPTIAVSVMDKTGSAIPAMVAGIANLFMDFRVICVSKKTYS